MRRRVLAAVLNAFIWGLGYLYEGKRILLGLSLVFFFFSSMSFLSLLYLNQKLALAVMVAAYCFLSLGLALDVYLMEGERGGKD